MLPQDHHARTSALDPARSFAVTAPAGSGKTGLLTQRVLKLLPYCDNPEEVVCITFTRKAAAEMQERIASAIHTAANTPRPENEHDQLTWDLAQAVIARDSERNWQLLKNPSRLRVQTIDGLCRSLTQHNPIESGIGGRSQLLEQPASVYRGAVQRTLKSIEEDGQLQHDLKELFLHLDNNLERVTSFLVSLLWQRDQWLLPLLSARNARDYLETVLTDLIEETLSETALAIAPFASELCLLADYAGNNSLQDKPSSSLCELAGITELPDTLPDCVDHWRSLSDLLLTASGSWRSSKGLNKNFGFPAGSDKGSKAAAKEKKNQMGELLSELKSIPNLEQQLQLIRILPPPHYPHSQWRLLDGLTRIMPHAVVQLKLAFRSLNATDFSEITQGALQALGDEDEPTELTLKLDYQIRHILVDEFQDTASPQLQLLERLTAGWQPNDGRTIFIVGDGMQSCYGFRDANVGIFLDARANGIGSTPLECLDLSVNFRSQSGVVDWVNDAFENAFPEADDISRGAVRYSHSVAAKGKLEDAAVNTHVFVDTEDRHAEANKVVDLVKDALAEHPEDRVAILARNRPHLKEILSALQAADLQWQATDIDPLANRMAIQDLITLTQAMLFPASHNAWLALLRSPIIGLDNSDLLALARMNGRSTTLFHSVLNTQNHQILSHQGQCILSRATPLLRIAWQDRRRKNLRPWLEGLWVALGGPASLGDPSDNINASDYFSLLERYDDGGTIHQWEEFMSAVCALYARPSEQADARIQVMTIHKSKGLEFETVIIPGLDKIQRSDDKQLLMWMERINHQHQKQLLLSPLSATGESDDKLYQFLRSEQKLKSSLEATRLLYVGCTRAINRLHLLANVKYDEKAEAIKAPASASLLAPLWPHVKDELNIHTSLASTTDNEKPKPLTMIRRLPFEWQRPALIPGSLLAAFRGKEFDDDENRVSDDHLRHRAARHTGTILHRCLAQVCSDGVDLWNGTRVRQQIPSWKAQLKMHGLHGQPLQDSLDRIELGLMRTLNSPTGRWLLDNTHHQSACELSLWAKGRSKAKNLIVDRTFVDSDTRWIIDYKSSDIASSESQEEFLQKEVQQYRGQLERYKQLFRDQPQTIKMALFFPMLAHLEIIEP